MRPIAVLCILSTIVFAQIVPSVPFTGGTIVFSDSVPPSVSMYDPVSGTVTLLSNNSVLMLPAGLVATSDGDVAFVDNVARTVVRVDPLGTLTTLNPTPLVNSPSRLEQDYDGSFVIANISAGSWAGMPGGSPAQLTRMDNTGATSIIATLGANPFSVIIHPDGTGGAPNGDYVATLPLTGDVVRADVGGAVTVLASGVWGATGIALFPNGDYCVTQQYTDTVVRIPRNGGTPTTYVAPGGGLGNIKDIVADGEGGFYVAEAGGVLGSRIMHIDSSGTVTQVLGNASFGTLQSICVVPNVRAPASVNTGGIVGLSVEFPAHANKGYVTVASTSVFPGIPFPGGDDRALSVNPDAIFLLTFGTGIPGLTTGWNGSLDSAGRSNIAIDLSLYPPGAFSGTRVYMQTGVLDPMAPTNIGQIGELVTLAF